ncbi:MAG: ABC transporter permease [Planctomycetota bacterium]
MNKLLAIAHTGLTAVLLHPLRSAATLLCIVAVLLPYVAGAAVARGLLEQAEVAIGGGADLHVAGERFGRPAPVPLSAARALRAIPGVTEVVPRIVGEVALGKENIDVVVVGLPAGRLPANTRCVKGRLFEPGVPNELVLGAELAHRLRLDVGSVLPPFYRNPAGERVSTVVGLFRADLPIWEANLMFCSLETGGAIFDQRELVTGFLIECEPGFREAVKVSVLQLSDLADDDAHGPVAPVVMSQEDLRSRLPQSLRHMEGLFDLHFVLAFAVGIPLLMVTSGLGLSERRSEAALLKATGWMTDELLLRGMVESLVLCLLGASLAVLLAWGWLDLLNGKGVAGIFLPGAEVSPTFRVPFRLVPVPALLGFIISFTLVATGTLYSTWRAATTPPALALR